MKTITTFAVLLVAALLCLPADVFGRGRGGGFAYPRLDLCDHRLSLATGQEAQQGPVNRV